MSEERRTEQEEATYTSFRSIKSINQELEQMIEELRDVKQIVTREELNSYLERANALKEGLKNPDVRAESYRNAQAPRAFRNMRDIYYEITKVGNTLIDAGYDASDIKDRAIAAKKDYNASLDSKEEAVLKVLISGNKGFAGDAHLIELQKKELERKQGVRGLYTTEKEEIDDFLDRVGEIKIDTYKENNQIVTVLETINRLLAENEKLKAEVQKLQAEKKEIENKIKEAEKKHDDNTMLQLNEELKQKKAEIKTANETIKSNKKECQEKASEFSKSKILSLRGLLQSDGEINLETLEQVNKSVLPGAKAKRDMEARAIAAKISVQDGIAGAMLGGSKGKISFEELQKYFGINGSITYEEALKNIDGIVAKLSTVIDSSDDCRRRIDECDREIRAIEGNIKMLEGRQPKPEAAKAGNGRGASGNYFEDKVKSAKEYEAAGVTLDQTYLHKGFLERLAERQKFAQTLYPKNMRGKGIRSWFRAIFNSRDIAYAMSHKKAQKELAETTLASAYRNTMKVLENNPNMTVEEAQTEALRNMLKREMGREMVDENAR